ncbi:AI-2E family transporter [Ancylobacter sp. 6x-1]|uniref:AI-2E family transporter n=1 Tax=Ancylobacter crimeensis TaxID=2579147 RepID=A0ABT0D6V1_9HYPH|nr:AI-2E family transporter [Ancylobacter crimeensis]MCK0195542.1 AI-2E family transporter [Ancylobacter crimeensis]
MLGIITVVVAAAALRMASGIIAPVAFALFVIALVWPLQRRIERMLPRPVAKPVAVLVTVASTLLVVLVLGYMVVWGFSHAAQWLIVNAARFQTLYADTAAFLEQHGIYTTGMLAETFNVTWLIRFLQTIAGRLNGMVGFAVVTFIFTLLGLLEADIIVRKLSRRPGEGAMRMLATGTDIARKFRLYMRVRTVMSLVTGLSFWGFSALLGLDLAVEFGVIAFALNYVPFIGPLVATLLPTLFALAQSGSWELAIAVFLGMNIIQFFTGSYIEPRVAGAALAMSPFLVLFAVFAWTFMWGVAGAFIGVPLTLAALTICQHGESTRGVAELLSGKDEALARTPS